MDNDERNHPPHVLRALGRLPAEETPPCDENFLNKDPSDPFAQLLQCNAIIIQRDAEIAKLREEVALWKGRYYTLLEGAWSSSDKN